MHGSLPQSMSSACQVGQPVICSGGNAFSEFVTVPARSCFGVRAADAEACTLAVSGLTAAGAHCIALQL